MNQELWAKLDKLRGAEIHSPEHLASSLQQGGFTLALSDLPHFANFLLSRLGFRFGGGTNHVPEWLLRIFTALVKDTTPRTMCDPWACFGVLVGTIQEAVHASQGLAFSSNQSDASLGRTLAGNVEWKIGDPLELLDSLATELDLVVSILPFGAKANRPITLVSPEGERVELRDDLGPMILASAASHLSRDGFGLFVITPSFFYSQRTVLRQFTALGLGIEAALALPAGTFAPYTAIPTYLVIIRKRPSSRMFVAQLSSDHTTNLQIISNFKQDQEGGSLELGRFVQTDSFKGLNAIRLAVVSDSLAGDPGDRYDMVLTNPPFGKKSSFTVVGQEGQVSKERETYERDDFWATTSNKQLNFLQHVKTLLKINGRAAIVVPDNVLFEGGAGETIRRKLLHECDVHTLLRLPTGLFYAQGVKANVLFFDKKPASETPWTKKLWIYDLRTNKHFTLKTNPLKREDLDEFVKCYNPANRHERKATWSEKKPDGRWRAYDCDELVARDKASLDIFWLKDESLEASDNLPDPDVIAQEIVDDLESALEQFRLIATDLGEASEKK